MRAGYHGTVPAPSAPKRPEHADCTILHVDMDAFFVAVELLDRPELKGTEVIVGTPGERSVVLSASYEARRYGVRSAMPMSAALRNCPRAVVIPPRQQRYQDVSAEVMRIFGTVTPLMEQLSVDEAFLDVSGALRRLGSPRAIGEQIRATVFRELGITASVGIAATKFAAKIASTRAKPNGLLLIPAAETVAYLHALPVSALWGVGSKTAGVLAGMGIRTVEQLAHTPAPTLRRMLGTTGEHLYQLAWGKDPRPVVTDRRGRSIGAEETFAQDVPASAAGDAVLKRELLRLAHRTASRLRAGGLQCGGVALKLRYADFSTLSRSRRLPDALDSAHGLYAAATGLLDTLGARPMGVRLIGLRAEELEPAGTAQQLTIDRSDGNWRLAEAALDEVHKKYGAGSMQPARLLPPSSTERAPDEGTEGAVGP
jgi:DNA polymerase-4